MTFRILTFSQQSGVYSKKKSATNTHKITTKQKFEQKQKEFLDKGRGQVSRNVFMKCETRSEAEGL